MEDVVEQGSWHRLSLTFNPKEESPTKVSFALLERVDENGLLYQIGIDANGFKMMNTFTGVDVTLLEMGIIQNICAEIKHGEGNPNEILKHFDSLVEKWSDS